MWAVVFSLVNASAQLPTVSQLISTPHVIRNEYGAPLKGTDQFSHQHGVTSVEGALVQVLLTTNNTIYPPTVNGLPDARNPVVATTRIGRGMSPAFARSGRFSFVMSPRPVGNTRLFVRVFNGVSPQKSSFYGDSQLFTVSGTSNTPFIVELDATNIPLDAGDADGDGLMNSWERSLGTDLYSDDTDGDGVSDFDEYIAGTDPLNSGSTYVSFVSMKPVGSGLVRLEWWPSVKDRTYRIFHAASSPDLKVGASLLSSLTTTGTENAVFINQDALSTNGVFWFEVSR